VGNVLRNAAAAGARRIDVQVLRRDGMAVVRVCDDGQGFTPESLERLFDRFFRVETCPPAVPLPGASGTGLGLAIVKAVVEAHGGSVRAANAHGGGAIVELVLPEDPAGPPFDSVGRRPPSS
jgi:signal transduction histidine kinase